MTKAATKDIKIPFTKLALDPMNVRKNHTPQGIAELAQNIAVQGILQNLVVRPAKKRGHYLVTAGGRRFRAGKGCPHAPHCAALRLCVGAMPLPLSGPEPAVPGSDDAENETALRPKVWKQEQIK